MTTSISSDQHVRDVVEIEIKVPFGHVAAKWWGRRDIRPILCIHGLLDNAASFDTIIPLLPDHVGYLAIDLPGHGKSSRIPTGMVYTSITEIYIINYIVRTLGWDKVSLMGHSTGAILSFVFAATFPERVDLVIALDALQPMVMTLDKLDQLVPSLERVREIEEKITGVDSKPPTYTIDEMVEKINLQTLLAVSRQSALYLLARASKESNIEPGKWFFTADTRLKLYHFALYTKEINESFAESIECPFLYVKYLQSPYVGGKGATDSILEVLMEKPTFSMITVDGDRYVHLNNPEVLSDGLVEFLCTHLVGDRSSVVSKL